MIAKPAAALSLLLLAGGCNVYRDATSNTIPTSAGWRAVTPDEDRDRLRNWHQSWDDALPQAKAENAAAIAADPLLFDPDRAQANAAIPAGDYRCRTFKLGKAIGADRAFGMFPAQHCRILPGDDGVMRFRVTDGAQRPTGMIFAETRARSIFLGTLVLSDEKTPLRYGLDSQRDMIGYVERIDTARWRLVLPAPHFESLLDVIEIVPAS
jgi:hypothetical protein